MWIRSIVYGQLNQTGKQYNSKTDQWEAFKITMMETEPAGLKKING